MRNHIRAIAVALALTGVIAVSAQESPASLPVPVASVGFIEDNAIGTASISNSGGAGITRLADRVRSLGATVRILASDEPIPPDIELVAIIGPTRALSLPLSAYLWQFLERGGHLLLAIDPNGHNGVSGTRSDGALPQLLDREYGIRLADTFVIEPWFSSVPLADVATSWSHAAPEAIAPHPIMTPLIAYDLPVRYWGGRSLTVEAVNGTARTAPLFFTESAYGETGALDLRAAENLAQFTRNIGADAQGHLLLGAVAEHVRTGSRVAVVGDSEIFRNLFGQTRIFGRDDLARYPGNGLFIDRLLTWLMGFPEGAWPGLPADFTPIALDGDSADWPPGLPVYGGIAGTTERQPTGATRAAFDDQFLYLNIVPPDPALAKEIVVELRFDIDGGQALFRLQNGLIINASQPDPQPIADAAYTLGVDVEVRLPLRLVPTTIAQLCIGDPANVAITTCTAEPITASQIATIAPDALRTAGLPSAYTIDDANIRTGPGLTFGVITLLRGRIPLRVLGRSVDGEWIRVENGRYTGWVSRPLILFNADPALLPVVE